MSTDTPAPARTRGYKKKERTRTKLLASAVDVIAEHGAAFSVVDVVRVAGVSNGTFYNYFLDRDALVDAVVREVVGEFATASAAAVEVADPAQRFATITALTFGHAEAWPKLARVLLQLEELQSGMEEDDDPLHHLRLDLAAGAAEGRFTADATDAVIDLVTGTMFAAVRRIITRTESPSYRADVIVLMLNALGLEAAEAMRIAETAVHTAEFGSIADRPADLVGRSEELG